MKAAGQHLAATSWRLRLSQRKHQSSSQTWTSLLFLIVAIIQQLSLTEVLEASSSNSSSAYIWSYTSRPDIGLGHAHKDRLGPLRHSRRHAASFSEAASGSAPEELELPVGAKSLVTDKLEPGDKLGAAAPVASDQTAPNCSSPSESELDSNHSASSTNSSCPLSSQDYVTIFIAGKITPILFFIIVVVGLVGNIVVMLVILEDRRAELTPPNMLILDLSIADLSFIIFCIPFTGWDYATASNWVFGLTWCKLNQYLIVVCALSSIYTLVLMSFDRFLAVVYPIQCMPYRTSRNTLYAIMVKWLVILVASWPVIERHGLTEAPDEPGRFSCRFLSTQFDPLKFQLVFFINSYALPLILIFFLYFSLLMRLWHGARPQGHRESSKMVESKRKVTWLVASIVIVFALCWCPIQVMLIIMRLQLFEVTPLYVGIQVFAHTLGYMNSCINPIVYAFASESFNQSFKRSSAGRLLRGLYKGSKEPNSSNAGTSLAGNPNAGANPTTHGSPYPQRRQNNHLGGNNSTIPLNSNAGANQRLETTQTTSFGQCHNLNNMNFQSLASIQKNSVDMTNNNVNIQLEPRDRDATRLLVSVSARNSLSSSNTAQQACFQQNQSQHGDDNIGDTSTSTAQPGVLHNNCRLDIELQSSVHKQQLVATNLDGGQVVSRLQQHQEPLRE